MLTEVDRTLVERTFAQGPAALLEAGYSEQEVREFVERPEVKAHFQFLLREFDIREELESRTRHTTRKQLSRLTPGAVAILAQALAGPQYLMQPGPDGRPIIQRDANKNPIMLRAEVLPSQLRAAELILESLGVPYGRAKNEVAPSGTKIDMTFASTEVAVSVVKDDPTHEKESQRALSRERMRTVIAQLADKIPAMAQKIDQNLGTLRPATVFRRKKKGPRVKKPTS